MTRYYPKNIKTKEFHVIAYLTRNRTAETDNTIIA